MTTTILNDLLPRLRARLDAQEPPLGAHVDEYALGRDLALICAAIGQERRNVSPAQTQAVATALVGLNRIVFETDEAPEVAPADQLAVCLWTINQRIGAWLDGSADADPVQAAGYFTRGEVPFAGLAGLPESWRLALLPGIRAGLTTEEDRELLDEIVGAITTKEHVD